jgi:hypothetical protein
VSICVFSSVLSFSLPVFLLSFLLDHTITIVPVSVYMVAACCNTGFGLWQITLYFPRYEIVRTIFGTYACCDGLLDIIALNCGFDNAESVDALFAVGRAWKNISFICFFVLLSYG